MAYVEQASLDPLSSCLLLLAACAATRMAPPRRRFRGPEFPFRRGAMEPTDTLSVTVHGPSNVRAPCGQLRRDRPNGSTTTTRYYYWWFVRGLGQAHRVRADVVSGAGRGRGRDTVTVSFSTLSAETDLSSGGRDRWPRPHRLPARRYIVEGPR